jgi:hypothetical protein
VEGAGGEAVGAGEFGHAVEGTEGEVEAVEEEPGGHGKRGNSRLGGLAEIRQEKFYHERNNYTKRERKDTNAREWPRRETKRITGSSEMQYPLVHRGLR